MKFPSIKSVINFLAENDTYFDSSAIMNKGFEELMKNCARQLKESGTKILIPTEAGNQLLKLTESDNPQTAATARLRIEELSVFASQPIIKYVGNPKQQFLEPQQIIKLVLKYRNNRNLAVITCKPDLVHDILMQNSLQSYKGNHIHVFNISKSGHLYDYEENTSQYTQKKETVTAVSKVDSQTERILNMFGLA